jgi:uncharacterized protein (DUF608 family)
MDVSLEAFSPFVPLDAASSEIPGIIFRFTLTNSGDEPVTARFGAAQKNIVGWDGCDPILGNRHPHLGGNVNTIREAGGRTALVMENPSLPTDHAGAGQLVLATDAREVETAPTWAKADDFIKVLAGTASLPVPGHATQRVAPVTDHGYLASPASRPGETVNGGLIVPVSLGAGETVTVTFVLAWSFPNHYVNYGRWNRPYAADMNRSRLYLGTHYTTLYPTAVHAADTLFDRMEELEATTRAWVDAVQASTLDETMQDFLLAQATYIRSPTAFRTADGRFFGYEGSNGASTSHHAPAVGGSCPMNCTHVWNYEMALSRLFPDLERSMRETDYGITQAPEGCIPHRVALPVWITQQWNQPIGGPENPALDGMLGTLLKTYRETQQGGGIDWLRTWWPHVTRLYTYITSTWDVNGDGVLVGEQPNTFDIEFYGENIFIGALWLAALRAVEEMANILGDEATASDARTRFDLGTVNYDQRLWGGEYYIQTLADDEPREQQFLTGCLADQLLGQWWAFTLGLGYILPEDHVKTTLRSIATYNWRTDFHDIDPEERAFANADDHGLLILSWPRGDKPARPTRYHDEVWTGIEYQVAAACIHEGLVDEGMRIFEAARTRHNGVKRNPYNDIECGDHYARAMSGWTIIEQLAGYRYDAVAQRIDFAPVAAAGNRIPFVAGTAWGTIGRNEDGSTTLAVSWGSLPLAHLAGTDLSQATTVGAGASLTV